MGLFEAMTSALFKAFELQNLLYVSLGTIIGLLFGCLPGLSSVVGLSLLLPLTFGMDPMSGMFLYAGVMGANPFGGSISAILINTPGTAVNVATCFDGYPMTQRGEAGRALGISATASGLGAIFGLVILIALIPVVRQTIMLFGPPEFLMFILFGLSSIVVASRGNMIKGLLGGGLGMLLASVGRSPITGSIRFSRDIQYFWDGIELIPFVIGMFALSEVINLTVTGKTKIATQKIETKISGVWEGVKDVFRHKVCFFRSSAIGTLIGIIPGIGGATANFIAYTVAMQTSKHPEKFGTGTPEGVVAAESANNAKEGGSLLPTVGFGIPGSVEMAVLLGAFILHGLVPGPLLIKENLDIVWAIIWGLVFSNVLASTFGLLAAKFLVRVSFIEVSIIIPVVAAISLTGAYANRGNIIDMLMAVMFGFFSYFMRRNGFPVITLVIGFVLGKLAEVSFFQSLMVSRGDYFVFFKRPLPLTLFILLLLVLILPFIRQKGKQKDGA
ncbi:MAG: tripartite tricarboxylate transporter permease [Desulfobacterales bacterium]|nr:tripartite tricarboxylate transporter permease [Desulfobacterales bacterium]